jgi:hypothetical protein
MYAYTKVCPGRLSSKKRKRAEVFADNLQWAALAPPAGTMILENRAVVGRDCISIHFRALLAMAIQSPPQHAGGSIMTTLTPRHVQEAESDRRRIKDGWYAMNKAGQVCSGRFSNQQDCQAHIKQERAESGDIRRRGSQ